MTGEGIPGRVISLVPSITESLFEMGLGKYLVGITDYCIFPEDKIGGLKKIGGPKSVNIKEVCGLHPDLILANQEENRKEEIEKLIELGQRVVVFFPKTVSEAIRDLYEIGKLFRDANSIRVVQWLEKSIDWMRLATDANDKFRYFCPIWQGKSESGVAWWMTFNDDVYSSDLLGLFGGVNCFAARKRKYPLEADLGLVQAVEQEGCDVRYPRVTEEEILLSNPDVIILPTEPYSYTNRHIPKFVKMFDGISSERNKKVLLIDGTLIIWHGTRLSKSLQYLPKLLEI